MTPPRDPRPGTHEPEPSSRPGDGKPRLSHGWMMLLCGVPILVIAVVLSPLAS